MHTVSAVISDWAAALRFDDLPPDVVRDTKLRVLDVIGLALAGSETAFGRSVLSAGRSLHGRGPARVFGPGEALTASGAAFVNGSLSQALEFDDTHNESIVHMSSPAVAASVALAEAIAADGRSVIRAVAIANEISTRIGSAAPGQFHKRGFHPTGLFTPFGVAISSGAMLGVDGDGMRNAAGIVGSFAAGLLECWVDGAQSKFLHPGWAAQAGISAAYLAQAGATGPAQVIEGRFGLFASHLQAAEKPDIARITDGLGARWESQNASFKPFPAAHVIHPYIDAVLTLRAEHCIAPGDVARIVCPVAPYIVGIVCEPIEEKRRPLTDSHGRVSIQYTLAEALALGRLDKHSYSVRSLQDPEILTLTDKVEIVADPGFPGPERFKGAISIELKDGRILEHVEEYNRGSPQNPMSEDDIIAKFNTNAVDTIGSEAAARLVERVLALDTLADLSQVTMLTGPADV